MMYTTVVKIRKRLMMNICLNHLSMCDETQKLDYKVTFYLICVERIKDVAMNLTKTTTTTSP